ncbi:MAG: cytochrome P460 family protein [Reinekea sp.]|nr:cytochrome P460 family protein [Reinekea sp.]
MSTPPKTLTQKTFKLGLLCAPLLFSGCAVLSTADADPRWADYQQWTKINNQPITGDHTGFIGNLHEGATGFRQIYVNDIGIAASSGNAPYRYPVGTVVVKEQYKTLEQLEQQHKPGLTIMVKVSDTAANPAENWAWSRGYQKEAKTDDLFCAGCHTIALPNDFVFSNQDSLKTFQ